MRDLDYVLKLETIVLFLCLAGSIALLRQEQPNPPLAQTDRVRDTQSDRLTVVDWQADWAVTRQRPGYPLLAGVEHFNVHKVLLASGAYHHHPQIVFFQDRFFAAWSNHRSGEDGPGQKVIGAQSGDGESWSSLGTIFDSLDNVRPSSANGRSLIASAFLKVDQRLFATAIVNDSVGFGRMNTPVTGQPLSPIRTDEFPKRIRRGLGTLLREIKLDGKFGPTFWIGQTKPDSTPGFPDFQTAAELKISYDLPGDLVSSLAQMLKHPIHLSPWDFNSSQTECIGEDGSLLCEPATIALQNQTLVRYLRDLNNSQVIYVQFSFDNGIHWTTGKPTNIPDAPSKSVVGHLPDGTYFLIGNQVFSKRGTRRDPLTIGLSKDG
jgi:hypothetical protein